MRVLIAASALLLAVPLLAACNTGATNPLTSNAGAQQDRAGKSDEKGSATKSQNPTQPIAP